MIQNTLYFQNADCMEKKEEKKCCAQKKNFKNKSVLCMEFAKWQIKVKKHDLNTMYLVGYPRNNIAASFTENEKFRK